MKVELWNHLGEENSNLHLDARELYLYFFVSSLKRRDYVSIVSIDMLQDYLPVKFVKTKKDNKNIIRELMDRLILKKLISITYDGNNIKHISQVENKSLLYITINGDFKKGKIDDFNGYESISLKKTCSFEKIEYLYIYYVIAKYKNKCVVASSRWASKLGIGETKAKELLSEMVSKEIIYVNAGDYVEDNTNDGQKLRNPNQYSLTPFKEEEKSNMQRKKEQVEDVTRPEEISSTDTGNWYSNNKQITKDDIRLYVTSSDEKFREHCESKMKQIRDRVTKKHNDKSKGDYIYNQLQQQIDDIEAEMKREVDEEYTKIANEIIVKTNDVALLVGDKIISYEKWNKQDKVKRAYYQFGKWESAVDDFIFETYYRDVSSNEDVELHRPTNGEWDDEHKQERREMEMEDWSYSPY